MDPPETFVNGSHEVGNFDSSVVTVCVSEESTKTLIGAFCEWVSNDSITSLESNFWLEGLLTNSTYHLERYIWAVEETSIIRR